MIVEPRRVSRWLPEGVVGEYSIVRFRDSDGEPGTTLLQLDKTWMIDDRRSVDEHAEFVAAANGRVLLSGLGIGYLPDLLLQHGRCTHIAIIEKSPEVISLVWPHLQKQSPILRLIEADADTYVPQEDYDWAWCDHRMDYPDDDDKRRTLGLWQEWVKQIVFWSPGAF